MISQEEDVEKQTDDENMSEDELSAALKEQLSQASVAQVEDPMDLARGLATIIELNHELGGQVLDAVSSGDWATLYSLVDERGLHVTKDDIAALEAMQGVAGQLAKVGPKMATDVAKAYARALDSDNFSESFLAGVIQSLANLARVDSSVAQDVKTLLEYMLGEVDIAEIIADRDYSKILPAIVNMLTNKLSFTGGKFGMDMVTSYALSILINLLPEEYSRNNLLTALAGMSQSYRMGSVLAGDVAESVTLVTDFIANLINQFDPDHPVTNLGGVQILDIDGVNWFMIPFANGMIGIAGKPVAGPDVRLVWNKWSPGAKQVLSAINTLPYVGDTIVQLFNAAAAHQTFDALVESIKQLPSEDSAISYLKYLGTLIARQGAERVAKRIRSKVDAGLKRMLDRLKEFGTSLIAHPSANPSGSEINLPSSPSEEGKPSTPAPSLDDVSEESLAELVGGLEQLSEGSQAYAPTPGVESWYSGRRPVTPGAHYKV